MRDLISPKGRRMERQRELNRLRTMTYDLDYGRELEPAAKLISAVAVIIGIVAIMSFLCICLSRCL